VFKTQKGGDMIFSLITNLEHLDVILASASPRRFELLSTTGIKFKVIPSHIDENKISHKDPSQYVMNVAFEKGAFIAKGHQKELVISADTIVLIGKEVLGKPQDENDAFRMLSLLSGKKHTVITAFALFLQKYEKTIVEIAKTEVTMRKLHADEIWAYVSTGEPMDKAGAYAIQGQGAMLIEKIEGCYSNVVGFPLSKFFTTLDHFLEGLALCE
jgi:nucleoside triphosphate pyrophosphatase